jgi:hypothetical protein
MLNKSNTTVYIAAYEFPPAGGGGVQRPAKLAKYLSRLGWEVNVICSSVCRFQDNSLLEEALQEKYRIARINSMIELLIVWLQKARKIHPLFSRAVLRIFMNLLNKIFFPDFCLCWSRKVGKFLLKTWFRENKNLIVITTFAPFSLMRIGKIIKSNRQIYWIADFRDSFVENVEYSRNKEIMQRWQDEMIPFANVIITVSDEISSQFRRFSMPAFTVPNGYDEEDLAGLGHRASGDIYRISYLGSLYGNRRPDAFLNALKQAESHGLLEGIPLSVYFIGNIEFSIARTIKELSEKSSVDIRLVEWLDHKRCLQEMVKSDLLLLFLPQGKENFTAKVFEYLRSGVRILYIGDPDTGAADLIRRSSPDHFITDNSSSDFICECLKKALKDRDKGLQIKNNEMVFKGFTREIMAQRFADIISGLDKKNYIV